VNGKKITNLYETGKILNNLKSQRALIKISMPGVPDVFFSSILEVNVDSNYILIDELNKKNAHEIISTHKILTIEAKLDGVGIRFSTELDSFNVENNIYQYKLFFPEYLLYFQKRQNYRINIGLGTNIPAKFKRDDGTPVFGQIINLSESGIGAVLDAPYRLEMSEVLPHCEIRLDDELSISSQLEIRYITESNGKKCQHIGGKFIGLSSSAQRLVAKLVIELQRDLMRRLPKDDVR